MTTPTEPDPPAPKPDGRPFPESDAAIWRAVLRRQWLAFAVALVMVTAVAATVLVALPDDGTSAPPAAGSHAIGQGH